MSMHHVHDIHSKGWAKDLNESISLIEKAKPNQTEPKTKTKKPEQNKSKPNSLNALLNPYIFPKKKEP